MTLGLVYLNQLTLQLGKFSSQGWMDLSKVLELSAGLKIQLWEIKFFVYVKKFTIRCKNASYIES